VIKTRLPTKHPETAAEAGLLIYQNVAHHLKSKISEPTATAGKTDLAGMAKSAGIEHAVTVRDVARFRNEATGAIGEAGLRFVVAKVEESRGHRKIERTNVDLLENKYQFVRYLERTEGNTIFKGRG